VGNTSDGTPCTRAGDEGELVRAVPELEGVDEGDGTLDAPAGTVVPAPVAFFDPPEQAANVVMRARELIAMIGPARRRGRTGFGDRSKVAPSLSNTFRSDETEDVTVAQLVLRK
jgi:hypothetical protein